MKVTRSAAAVIVLLLVTLAALTFLYGVASGRRARREAVRLFRVARNTTGIYAMPVVTVRVWGGARQAVVLVEIFESGRIVVSGRGDRIERQLTREAAATIIRTARSALGDFNGAGCGLRNGGINAELYVLIDGARSGSICRDASGWPRGAETRALFAELERNIPGTVARFQLDYGPPVGGTDSGVGTKRRSAR